MPFQITLTSPRQERLLTADLAGRWARALLAVADEVEHTHACINQAVRDERTGTTPTANIRPVSQDLHGITHLGKLTGVSERYVAVNGTRLFVDLRGRAGDPPLLYLHGGPGMSCHEFMIWQGDRLSRRLFVIGLDQRGVLRSDALGPDEVLTEDILVDDCEAVRAELGIRQWTVLGHSFGGRVALRYACRYPDRVRSVIFESPGWDMAETERQRLPAAAAIFDELGDRDSARRCRELAAEPLTDSQESFELIGRLAEHDRYDDLYVHQPGALARWLETQASPFPEELRSRAQAHQEQVMKGLLEPVTPLLANVTAPATLIIGGHDPVTGPAQVAAFERLVPNGRVVRFPDAAHFVQLEEPEAYADLVTHAVTQGRSTTGST